MPNSDPKGPSLPSPDLLAPPPQAVRLLDVYPGPAARQGTSAQLVIPEATTARDRDDGAACLETGIGWLKSALQRQGLAIHLDGPARGRRADAPPRTAWKITLVRTPTPPAGSGGQAEAYRLRLDDHGARLEASTSLGLFRALTSLVQWLDLHPARSLALQGLEIVDWPDFAHRGLMLDISRNRVPTLRELEATVERLARLKMNQLQLYMEHTFAYAEHGRVWAGWSPLLAEDIRHLDAYARRRGVDLVPNQNSFGHLHRWLVHPPYRDLAECPDGIEHPFSPHPEPFGLCPTDPGSLTLLDDLFAKLLPCFQSRLFNIGLDETLDLGHCRSRDICQSRGTERVYLDFLLQVCDRAREHGRRPLFWGDIVLEQPELIAELPADSIVLEWGYEPDHPFAEDAARFADAGRDFYVCPGTGAWSSYGGRLPEAFANLASAAHHGKHHGALGYLITDWGDHGHLQPPPIGWPGLLVGACHAWSSPSTAPLSAGETAAELGDCDRLEQVEAWLAAHILEPADRALARPLLELGHVHRLTGARALNGSPLFYALHFAHLPSTERRGIGMTVESLERALEKLSGIRQATDSSSSLLGRELRWVTQMLELAARFAQLRLHHGSDQPLIELPVTARHDLLHELEGLAEELAPIWLARSRPGGLRASRARLLALRPWLSAQEPGPSS